jgi:hypothetical protein
MNQSRLAPMSAGPAGGDAWRGPDCERPEIQPMADLGDGPACVPGMRVLPPTLQSALCGAGARSLPIVLLTMRSLNEVTKKLLGLVF